MVKLSEMELKALIQGGETNTVELKVAAPRASDGEGGSLSNIRGEGSFSCCKQASLMNG
jgi:hypothetical protein